MIGVAEIYIAIALITLVIIAILVFYVRKKPRKQPSKLAWFAFVFILAGIIFGDDLLIGYSLMGVGVILAIVDIIKNHR